MTTASLTLARPGLDFGLPTDNGEAQCRFYGEELGLKQIANDVIIPGQYEIFYELHGSWLKINASDVPMEPATTGYTCLHIADANAAGVRELVDPDGLAIRIVPKGYDGIDEVGLTLTVNDIAAHQRFLLEGCGATPVGEGYRVGNTVLFLDRSPQSLTPTPIIRRGFTMLTFVVHDLPAVHQHLLEHGGSHGMRICDDPGQPGRCLFSFVRDPSGNWIELVEFAPDGGSLPTPTTPDPTMEEFLAFRDHGTPV